MQSNTARSRRECTLSESSTSTCDGSNEGDGEFIARVEFYHARRTGVFGVVDVPGRRPFEFHDEMTIFSCEAPSERSWSAAERWLRQAAASGAMGNPVPTAGGLAHAYLAQKHGKNDLFWRSSTRISRRCVGRCLRVYIRTDPRIVLCQVRGVPEAPTGRATGDPSLPSSSCPSKFCRAEKGCIV